MNSNVDTFSVNFQDTMQGIFVVAFISLIIMQELTFQLSQERKFDDKRKKMITYHAYSLTDVLDITRGITINFSKDKNSFWFGGVLKEIKQLCTACGLDPNFYSQVPIYLKLV